mmetsp:Transcript_36141/g.93253  ORF Transcript_36141/g.93253 Transcript_36141/m.93253 type:complete len:514 (-) Transcript_36141:81-1622(-)
MILLLRLLGLALPVTAHLFTKTHVHGHGHHLHQDWGQWGQGGANGWIFPGPEVLHDWHRHGADAWEALKGSIVAEKTKTAALEKKVERLERKVSSQHEECNLAAGKASSQGMKDVKAAKDKAARKQSELEAEKKRRAKLEKEKREAKAQLEAEKAAVGKLKQELQLVGTRNRELEAQLEDTGVGREAARDGHKVPVFVARTSILVDCIEALTMLINVVLAGGASIMDSMEAAAVVVLGALCFLSHRRAEHLEAEVRRRKAALLEEQAAVARLEEELHTELGGMMSDVPAGHLGGDFSWRVWDESHDEEVVRKIKIQCPGARHQDISVDIIFNGCVVKIARPASPGVDEREFVKQFQFRPSSGLFEFRMDQVQLDQGYLLLEFCSYNFRRRVFCFPPHHQLDRADMEGSWELPSEATEPSLSEMLPTGSPSGSDDAEAVVTAALPSPSDDASSEDALSEDFELLQCQEVEAVGTDPPNANLQAMTSGDSASEFERVGSSNTGCVEPEMQPAVSS